jgi:peptide/nickel transport system substrate-binding protein
VKINTRHMRLGIGLTVVAMLSVACTAGGNSNSNNNGPAGDVEEVRTAFSFDMQVPDPDIFFQAEGLNVTTAAYEGLLRHVPNAETPEIEPWLATDYKASEDGLTYTFTVRDGVKFQDGTDMDAEAVKFSFERRMKINAGPNESLIGVKSVEAPDARTVVVHMEHPVSSFIPFIASAYGLKIVSPRAVKEHEVDGDLGQKWLATHSAGTGPLQIASFKPSEYVLERFDEYWGEPAGYKRVKINVVPSFTSQVLQLESGQLDFLTHGVPTDNLQRLKAKGFTVTTIPTFNRASLWLNEQAPAFATAEGRNAIAAALDREAIVSQVYGEYADIATQIYPAGVMSEGMAEYKVGYDLDAAKEYVDSLPASDRTIDLAYIDDDPDNQQVAQLIQSQLQAAGLDATARSVTQPETFDYPTKPEARPDMLFVGGISDDAAHPDPVARLFYDHDGALSYFTPTQAEEADTLLDQGLREADEDKSTAIYAQAGDIYAASGLFIPIADRPEVIVTREGIAGVEHEFNAIWSIRLASLKEE